MVSGSSLPAVQSEYLVSTWRRAGFPARIRKCLGLLIGLRHSSLFL
nr:MAG TPA: hypothetical protein [Bacteriophage sp.]